MEGGCAADSVGGRGGAVSRGGPTPPKSEELARVGRTLAADNVGRPPRMKGELAGCLLPCVVAC